MGNMPFLLQSLVRREFFPHHVSSVTVVDANKDLEEMQEVFARQEKIVFGRARQMKKDDEKENCRMSIVGSKRTASRGRRKAVFVEKAKS